MQLILHGKILTPIVSKDTKFFIWGCKAEITIPSRRYFSKITTNKPMFPFSYMCYLGTIKIRYYYKTMGRARRKLGELLKIKSIGKFASEGLGKVQWERGYIEKTDPLISSKKRDKKLKIRKGLPHYLPNYIRKLLQYALLHDFFHTSTHKSKIYVEPELDDLGLIELLRQHHEKSDNNFIKEFQKYDHIAARITRKIRSPRTNRYNWYSNKKIDFNQLATEIKEVSINIWKLYDFILHNRELTKITESLEYGHTSLKSHLLIITNLIVQDFQQERLKTSLYI